jgi:hypothetical protein
VQLPLLPPLQRSTPHIRHLYLSLCLSSGVSVQFPVVTRVISHKGIQSYSFAEIPRLGWILWVWNVSENTQRQHAKIYDVTLFLSLYFKEHA